MYWYVTEEILSLSSFFTPLSLFLILSFSLSLSHSLTLSLSLSLSLSPSSFVCMTDFLRSTIRLISATLRCLLTVG